MCTTILGWGGILGLLAYELGVVFGCVGFCEGVCMGAGMLDIGQCEVLIGCLGASQLCRVASIFCTYVNASFIFSISAVWSGGVMNQGIDSAMDRHKATWLQGKQAQDTSLQFPNRFRAGQTMGNSRSHLLVQVPECGNESNQAWESCTTTG